MEARKIQDKDYVSRYARRGTRSFWAPVSQETLDGVLDTFSRRALVEG